MASDAALEAVFLCSNKQFTNRMKMTVMFPEMNPSMDSYRIGTLLELARSIAIKLAEQNLRVRVCVQGSMGVGIFTGVPKQLNGVHTLLQRMDWESLPGEQNEGMVGDYVNFGFVGKDHVVNEQNNQKDGEPDIKQDDVFLILCPQNMVGLESSIIGSLSEMVDAAGDRPVILLNPDLTDKISSQGKYISSQCTYHSPTSDLLQVLSIILIPLIYLFSSLCISPCFLLSFPTGQQSIRGRQQRLDFANSFETIYQFQNIYFSGTSYFPILGSVVKMGPLEPWVAHQRRDLLNDEGEVYLPVYSSESVPENEILMSTFAK